MKGPVILKRLRDDPREREIDRLLDLHVAGFLSLREYLEDKAIIERAIAAEAER